MKESRHDAPAARMQGQWLCWRSTDPSAAVTAAPSSGSTGINQRYEVGSLNMAGLFRVLQGLRPGRGEVGERLLDRRRRQRLLIDNGILIRLAQVLPEAD